MPRKHKDFELNAPIPEDKLATYTKRFFWQTTYYGWSLKPKIKDWRIDITGTGHTLKEAMINMAERAIYYFKESYKNANNDNEYRDAITNNLFLSTAFKFSVENGISTAYHYPLDIGKWRTLRGIINRQIKFPFVGFGRSPKQAKVNALKFLLKQYTIALRNADDDPNEKVGLQCDIDSISRVIAHLKTELDIFESIKAIENFEKIWAEAPKPAESEPVKVPA